MLYASNQKFTAQLYRCDSIHITCCLSQGMHWATLTFHLACCWAFSWAKP